MTANPNQRNLKLLLVDDDLDTRQMVTISLKSAGLEIQAVATGSEALALLGSQRMDIILLDIMLPDVDGLNLLETIRRFSDTPILMLTAVSHAEIMQQAYILGADDYIVKPFTREKLLDRIYRLANKTTAPVQTLVPSWTRHYWLDADNHILVNNGTAIDLSDVETLVMLRLMASAFQAVSELDLYKSSWGNEPVSLPTRLERVESAIQGIQLKLEEDPAQPKIVISTPEGYVFTPESG
ncbi:MAG: response regulator transcription factor [Bellilinea sp.]